MTDPVNPFKDWRVNVDPACVFTVVETVEGDAMIVKSGGWLTITVYVKLTDREIVPLVPVTTTT